MRTQLIQGAKGSGERFRAIDWLRGLSVLFMIECHALYFLRPDLERTPLWHWLQGWNGLVSVSFLFAAGFAAGLVGSRGMAKAGDAAARRNRSIKTLKRIAAVWAVSLYFRLTSFPVFDQQAWLLKFDILTCICTGLLAVWVVLNVCRTRQVVAAIGVAALGATALAATPWAMGYRGGEIVTGWLNGSNGSMFTPFPWLGYLLLGALLGMAAARPRWGRINLAAGLFALTAVGYVMGETEIAKTWWRSLGHYDHVYPLYNVFERLWKLGLIGLTLCGIEAAWPVVGRVLAPVSGVLEYFSRNALGAYFAHLTLLYGCLGVQFTQVWHKKSDWTQFTWRVALLIGGTVLVCHLLDRAKAAVAAAMEAIREAGEETSAGAAGVAGAEAA
jgi:uncharacterized membrane protein